MSPPHASPSKTAPTSRAVSTSASQAIPRAATAAVPPHRHLLRPALQLRSRSPSKPKPSFQRIAEHMGGPPFASRRVGLHFLEELRSVASVSAESALDRRDQATLARAWTRDRLRASPSGSRASALRPPALQVGTPPTPCSRAPISLAKAYQCAPRRDRLR